MPNKTTLTTAPAIAFFLMFNIATSFSHNIAKTPEPAIPGNSEICLEINGKLSDDMKKDGSTYTVKLIQNNEVIEQVKVSGADNFKLHLKRNNSYTIRVEKEGFIPRHVSVSTHMPEEAQAAELFKFDFDIELFATAYAKYFEPEEIELPIALIAFDADKKLFDYDKDFSQKVQERMHVMGSEAR